MDEQELAEFTLSVLKEMYVDRPIRLGVEITKELDRAFSKGKIKYAKCLLDLLPFMELSDDAMVGLLANIKTQCKAFGGLCEKAYLTTVAITIKKIRTRWSPEDVRDAKRILL